MRSSWKIPFIHRSLARKIKAKNLDNLYFFCRNSLIPLGLVDKKVKIYNGVWSRSFFTIPQSVGMKFGEFSLTKCLGKEIHTVKSRKK